MSESISAVLDRARAYRKPQLVLPEGLISISPHMRGSLLVQRTLDGMMKAIGCTREVAEDALMRARNCGEILTPEELADRLKVKVEWIYEKRRPRCPNPLPAIPMGRTLRFDWDAIVKWLEAQAAADAKMLKSRRG